MLTMLVLALSVSSHVTIAVLNKAFEGRYKFLNCPEILNLTAVEST